LRKLYPELLYFEIHPDDAETIGCAPGHQMKISSRRGSLIAYATVTATVQPGQIFLPMHYPSVNRLTYPSFDPFSRQPSYKSCAVRIDPCSRGASACVKE
jgi:assimilatory nitrate reductase catalytic subunit